MLAFTASAARADAYEGYKSTIEGIGLWWLVPGAQGVKRLRFGENPEFAVYCDGRNKLFIYEMANEAFTCMTEWNGKKMESFDSTDMKKMLNTIKLAKRDKYSEGAETEYFVSLQNVKVSSKGFFTVSKTKLLHGSWDVTAPTKDEFESSAKHATLNLESIQRDNHFTYKSVLGYDNKNIGKLVERHRDEAYTVKIQTENLKIILLPTLFESSKEQSGDIIFTVVAHDQDGFRFIGHVHGCLLTVGADIDSDGVPEVILENCNSGGLSSSVDYIKLFPKLKSIISFSNY